tara:strand:- start:37 stop:477 length:441 start_codon:yes stop_codon:yes gene_type:complete
MKITEVTKPNQLKANSRTPKVIKPSKGHESRNVTRGKLVGEADEPTKNTSARATLNHSLLSRGHKVVPDKKKTIPDRKQKHKGKKINFDEGVLVLSKPSDLMAMLDTLLKSWKGKDHSDQEFEELINALGYTYKKEGDRVEIKPDR